MPTRRLVLLFALACGLAGFSPAVRAHDEFRFVGALVKVDLPKNVVSVKYKEFDGKEETVDVKLTAKTRITRDGKTAPRSQLRVGEHVVIDALGCEDDYDATSIRLVPPPK